MKTVLIVEDNTTLRENISEILALKGYNILTALDGKTGLAMAKEKKPDIILCDVLMPEMDGYNAFNSLKDSPYTMNIPFIFITAEASNKEIENGLAVGADGYITKPFDGNELCAAIDRCLVPAKKSAHNKTENELSADILKITMTIKREFPELVKYLNEMPVTIPNSPHPEINMKSLNDYYNSLDALVKDYALSHKHEGK